MGILNVHNLIADVIGSLHEVDQWMTGICSTLLITRWDLWDSQLIGNAPIGFSLGGEEAELALFTGMI